MAKNKQSKHDNTKTHNASDPKNSESSNTKHNDSFYDNTWGKMFESFVPEDVKNGMNYFMSGMNGSICDGGRSDKKNDDAKNMMEKLSLNLKNSFEQNVELGSEILKCKTASDFLEFQKKNFEINYKNSVKLYSDLFHDIQNLIKNLSNQVSL